MIAAAEDWARAEIVRDAAALFCAFQFGECHRFCIPTYTTTDTVVLDVVLE